MPALDDLWDYDDPAASEALFRTAIEAAVAGGDPTAADEARTQLSRALGLQGKFEAGHAILDRGRHGPPGRRSNPRPVSPGAWPPLAVGR